MPFGDPHVLAVEHSEHEPGPWTLSERYIADWTLPVQPIRDATGDIVCEVPYPDIDDHQANIALLLAAPDLLAACMAALVPAGDTPEEIKAQLRIAVNKAMRPQLATEPSHDH